MKRGRPLQTYCSGMHAFDAENTYVWIDQHGYEHRACRICRRRSRKEYRRREKRRLNKPLAPGDHKSDDKH